MTKRVYPASPRPPEAPSSLALDQQICFALYRASRAVIRAYGPLLEPLGITYPQYLVLLVLWEGDARLVKEIGECLSLDSATLTPLLKRLEEKGLISRQRSDADERKVYIRLTAQGKKLRDSVRGVPQAIACAVGFDIRNAQHVKSLDKLRDSLMALAASLESGPDRDLG